MSAAGQWRLAYLFPGQGSQYVGMARELGVCEDGARALLGRAEEVTGLPVADLMRRADAVRLADPEVAQVTVFVLSLALFDELSRRVGEPSVVAGHSLGEYTALAACGSLDRDVALRLVSARGKAMAEAARQRPGTMAALVGLRREQVEALCDEAADRLGCVVVANRNSPKQAVVSGTPEAVEHVVEGARAAGALRARLLAVGGAYHSPLMAPAEAALRPHLEEVALSPPRLPLVSSVTGSAVVDIEAYREDLLSQVSRPVRWGDVMSQLVDAGVESFVEAGPGRVLTGLSREVADPASCRSTSQALRSASERPALLDVEESAR